ncbi:MAG: S1 RNA-binding domain-containing protein [Acidobacteria bacterium]|nr:S1 RNA-binding domain-containing protein [Acidobacteriota bacterium]
MNPTAPQDPVQNDQTGSTPEESFGDILSQFESEHRHTTEAVGESVNGTVVSIGEDAVLIDVGRKSEGALALATVTAPDGTVMVKPGDQVSVTITGRHPEGFYLLSKVHVAVPKDWSGLQQAFNDRAIITGTVTEVVKGGLRVDVGATAFMPASRSGARDVAEMEKLVGAQIECRITKLDTEKEDVVVDRRIVLEELAAKAKEERFSAIQEGTVMMATVRSLTDFGAFCDLGGVDGLLHISDMAWQRVAKPDEIVKTGEQIQVKVLKVQPEKKKISLGLKQLTKDPWTVAAETIHVGDRVKGKVVRLADFGAFIELLPGVDGLIHVTALSWDKRIRKPGDILKVDEYVEAVVLGVNLADKKISLSLKQAIGDPWEEVVRQYPVGSIVEKPVTSLANFGAFVEVENGIEGMIHIGDITREKRLQHPKEALTVGQTVKAQVTEVDNERRRLRLSVKALEPTSADVFISESEVGSVVSGRVVKMRGERADVELGEGVHAMCRLAGSGSGDAGAKGSGSADLGSLSAMLAAKWKSGGPSMDPNALREGQVRRFKIVAMDAQSKKIEVELEK